MPVAKARLGLLAIAATALLATPAWAQSLAEAMAYAVDNNPDITASYLSVRSARVGITAAEGGLLPTIGADLSLGASWNSATDSWTSSDSIGVGYSQTLFDNHATDAAIRGAQADYDAAVYAAANTEQNVLLAVVQAYIDVTTYRQLVAIRQDTIGFVEAQLQSARARLDLGEGTALDVAQAEASLAQTRASYQAALNSLSIAEANYMRAVGREPQALGGGYAYEALLPVTLPAALAQADAAHPALLATAAQIRAAQYGYEETMAGFGPSLSLTGNVGAGGWTTDRVTTSASIGLRLSVPIFTPTRNPALEQANIGIIQSEVTGVATRDQIVEAVRQSWAGLQAASAQISAATAAVAAGRIALDAVIEQNDVGQSTTLDVLESRSSVAAAQETLISAQAQRVVAAYSLIASIGALSAENLGLSVTPRTAEGVIVATPVVAPETDAWAGLR